MNNDPCKAFKNMGHYSYGLCDPLYAFGTKNLKNKQKLQFIWTYENMVKF